MECAMESIKNLIQDQQPKGGGLNGDAVKNNAKSGVAKDNIDVVSIPSGAKSIQVQENDAVSSVPETIQDSSHEEDWTPVRTRRKALHKEALMGEVSKPPLKNG
ncbi:hypothetical protein RIF29_25880 [Crotalaria pallida]|uniref:Uncharacterized protein n=1 Tax=Crotalaria pallida TaxID=3830 RepID=A0AAN9I4I5_CROPI